MRFDDRLDTLLAQRASDGSATSALWTQLVDITAQSNHDRPNKKALDQIAALSSKVSMECKRRTAFAVGRRTRNLSLIALLANDDEGAGKLLLSSIMLAEADWQLLIPQLSAEACSVLEKRGDLPQSVRRVLSLSSNGAAEVVATEAPTTTEDQASISHGDAGPPPPSQISELMARIENWREDRDSGSGPLVPGLLAGQTSDDTLRLQSDSEGIIVHVEGGLRPSLLGLSIGEIAEPGLFGVDGQVAGAVRKRMPFTWGRLNLAAGKVGGGEWRVSGVPQFRREDGKFTGYLIAGRRPLENEIAQIEPATQVDLISSDSMHQIAHELRTPLNAIKGFSELIGNQLFGPVSGPYRDRARLMERYAAQFGRLVEELENASWLNRPDAASGQETLDTLLTNLHTELHPMAVARNANLKFSIDESLGRAEILHASEQRAVRQLLTSLTGVLQSGEYLNMNGFPTTEGLRLSVSRPACIKGRTFAQMLASDVGMDDGDAALLGLGFSLRLVRALANRLGGRLEADADCIDLIIPRKEFSAIQVQESPFSS